MWSFLILLSFCCGVLTFSYDEKLAREKFLPLASAAYSKTPEDCVQNVFSDAKISKKVTVRCGNAGMEKLKTCSGFVGYSNRDKAIFLVYRGTISKYFYDAYSAINAWNKLGTSIKYLLWKYPEYKVWVTGHSLGGALAQIAAGELVGVQKVPSDRVVMINFGQPRVGNKEYVEVYEKLVPNAFRIVHANDLVPHVPPKSFDGYEHASPVVWYKGQMKKGDTYTQCLPKDEDKCANNPPVYSIPDHITYFETMFVLNGYIGCKINSSFSAANFDMAKSKNHTNHNQNRKDHRNGIHKPKRQQKVSLKGVDPKFLRNMRFSKKGSKKAVNAQRVAAASA
ncbi:Class 3 lipase protein [Aphelenchoides bicaudatus]|nr:Class 3 lipase protein [Aphelenchoides bicaudatus]